MKVFQLIETLLQHPETLDKDVVMPSFILDESSNNVWIDYENLSDITGLEKTKDGRVMLLD